MNANLMFRVCIDGHNFETDDYFSFQIVMASFSGGLRTANKVEAKIPMDKPMDKQTDKTKRHKKSVQKQCAVCEKDFVSVGNYPTQKTCGKACRTILYDDSKKIKSPEPALSYATQTQGELATKSNT